MCQPWSVCGIGAVGFGLGEAFADGERFLEVRLGFFVFAEIAGDVAEFVVREGQVALEVGAVGFGLGETFENG
jgi:hypothetical protein